MLKPVNLNLVTATGETSAFLGKLNIDMVVHTIDTGDARLIRIPPRLY